MNTSFVDRIDFAGKQHVVAEPDVEKALRQGEVLHRDFRPHIAGDYIEFLRQMAAEGVGMIQLIDDHEVRAIAIWRTFLTTYSGRRMEVDDLVTAKNDRSKGYGATMLKALEAKARARFCHAIMLNSATSRVDAHRFYLRERYDISAFQFVKMLR